MGRLPFDPGRMAAPGGGEPPANLPRESAPLTVSQLAVLVNRTLRDHLPTAVRLVGEIGQFRERTHWYFDVKDAGAVMSCVMFASSARRAGFVPQVGQQVLLTGRVEFYDKGGRTQFMVDRMEPIGAGALDLAFRRLCEELRALGWFEESRKRTLPVFPQRVAVVTSRTGAALQDVLDTARRRCPAVGISLVDVRVQGEGAAAQVAAAIRRLGKMRERLGIDVVLVTRGGGSMEDLWAFNEQVVAEAIVNSPIPVVAAIGHETDTTIAELVADLRGATPTQAAMRIFPDAAALSRQLTSMVERLAGQVLRQIRTDRERLRGASRHPFLADPRGLIVERAEELRRAVRRLGAAPRGNLREAGARLDRAAARLERHRPTSVYARRETALRHAESRLRSVMAVRLREMDVRDPARRLDAAVMALMERRSSLLQSAARGLDLVGPHSVLGRGYSMTTHADGRIIRSVGDVGAGEVVRTRLADGGFDSTVVGPGGEGIPSAPARGARNAAASRRVEEGGVGGRAGRVGRAGRAVPRDQMDLFGPGR